MERVTLPPGEDDVLCRVDGERQVLALKSHGFPSRIIAVAQVQGNVRLEKVAGQMMRAVFDQGGDYIEHFHQVGDIDEDLLRCAYDGGDDKDD